LRDLPGGDAASGNYPVSSPFTVAGAAPDFESFAYTALKHRLPRHGYGNLTRIMMAGQLTNLNRNEITLAMFLQPA
jgi:hypothetical protein